MLVEVEVGSGTEMCGGSSWGGSGEDGGVVFCPSNGTRVPLYLTGRAHRRAIPETSNGQNEAVPQVGDG